MDPPVVPPYFEMICAAIAGLKKEEGSSEIEISSYIERSYTGLPIDHRTLLTHHLKTLNNSGVLSMVNNCYKLAETYIPESVDGDVEATPKFDFVPITTVDNKKLLDMVFDSSSVTAAPESEYVPINDQRLPDTVSASGSVSGLDSQPQKRGRGRPPKTGVVVNEESSSKRRPGRPRKDGSALSPVVQATTISERPPASVGERRSGRAKRVDYTISLEAAPGLKRGRRGRPKKSATQDSRYGELKIKFNLFQEKAKEIVNILKAEVTSDKQTVVQAIQDLEGLTAMEETVEPPHVMEGAKTEIDGREQGQEKEVGGEKAQAQTQKEAESMQEAFF